jgi:HK97 gp10 family phage protein
MAKKTLSVEGSIALQEALAELPRDVRDEFREAVAHGSRGIVLSARERAPRDEGDLIASIDDVISGDGLTAEAGSRGVLYAAHVEWGTEDTAAQPYLFPAFVENLKPLRKDLRKIVADIPLKVRTRVKRDRRTR